MLRQRCRLNRYLSFKKLKIKINPKSFSQNPIILENRIFLNKINKKSIKGNFVFLVNKKTEKLYLFSGESITVNSSFCNDVRQVLLNRLYHVNFSNNYIVQINIYTCN